MSTDKEVRDEYADLVIGVTTDNGLRPIQSATVTVIYSGPPGSGEKASMTLMTDENGRCGPFSMYTRRARIGGKYVNFPRFGQCDVEIRADGFVPITARRLPIFPGITVNRSFDLISVKKGKA